MKNKHLLRAVVSVLIIVMLIGMFPVSVFAVNYDESKLNPSDDYYNVISKKDWNNAPGITESEIVLNNDNGTRRQVLHLMEVDMNNEYTKATTSYTRLDPTGVIPKSKYDVSDEYTQALYMQDVLGYNVIGAMNTCLSWYNGARYSNDSSLVNEPLGIMMVDGVVVSETCVGFPTCVVILDDNTVKMMTVNTVADIPANAVQVIPCSSGYIVKDGVNMQSVNHGNDTAPRSVVGVTADNRIIMFENDGRQAPISEGMTMYELAEVMIAAGCTYACNCDGGGSSTFVSKRPGQDLAIVNVPSDGAPRSTTSGIVFISTAPDSDALYQATVSAPADYYTPGASVQFTAVGSNMLGDEVAIPAEAEWVLADPSLGTIDQDGLFVSNGETGAVTAQLVYDNEVKGSATITVVIPEFAFKQAKLVLPYGEAFTITLDVTTNGGLNTVVTHDGDITLSLSDANMGSIDGMTFSTTDDTAVAGGTLTASAWGSSHAVEVKFGKASEVIYDFENNYEFIEDRSLNGSIDGDTNNNSWDNYIKGWHIADQKINMYYGYRNSAVNTGYTPVGTSCHYNVYKVDATNGIVRNGSNAMAIHWDCTSRTMAGPSQFDVYFPELIDVSEATQFGFWMYIPDYENMTQSACWTVRFVGMNAERSGFINVTKLLTDFTSAAKICDNGWIYISVDTIASNMAYMSHIHFYPQDSKGNVNPYTDMTFYVDDFTVDYSDAVIDREIPYFTSLGIANEFDSADEINGQTIYTNTIDLIAEAKENTAKENASGLNMASAKVFVDGVQVVNGITTTSAGKIAAANLTLANGVHTIRVEISDNQGNSSSITRKLTVNGDSGTVRLVPAENYEKVYTGSVVYFNLIADDIANIDSVSVKINLDEVNKWELEGMTTAYGFDAVYSINADQDLILTLTRNGSEVADTDVLATLPVRVWMTNSYLDPEFIATGYVTNDPAKQDKYWVLNPYAMWVTDGVTIIHVIADASEGLVTFADGTTESFSSVKYDITTEMNRYRNTKNAGDENFYQNKASFHVHEAGEPQNLAATCTTPGYIGRVFCVGCTCEDGVIASDAKTYHCDCADGCGSVIVWGEIVPATGHNYVIIDDVLQCEDCHAVYTGVFEGVLYADGIAVQGWIDDCYYVDGVALTGIQFIDGFYYDLGEDGVSTGKCNGLIEVEGVYHFAIAGTLVSGWQLGEDGWYYFDEETLAPVAAKEFNLEGVKVAYDFYENGRIVTGTWKAIKDGYKYYYGPDFYKLTSMVANVVFHEIDGKTYGFNKMGYRYTGTVKLIPTGNIAPYIGVFADDGVYEGEFNGIYNGFYYVDGYVCNTYEGLLELDGAYYYIRPNGAVYVGKRVINADKLNGYDFAAGTYTFGEDGKMVENLKNGVVDGYYYVDGQICKTYGGLVEQDGDYYFVRLGSGVIYKGKHTVNQDQLHGYDFSVGTYTFGEDGKMVRELKNGVVDGYYYVDGQICKTYGGLIEQDGDYYFVRLGSGVIYKGKHTVNKDQLHGYDFPVGTYTFGEDGKMVENLKNGVVDGYYYVDGQVCKTYGGLVEQDGYYYFVRLGSGVIYKGKHTVNKDQLHGYDFSVGTYTFGEDGRMIID